MKNDIDQSTFNGVNQMTKISAQRPVLGIVGLFSVLILANHALTEQVHADTNQSSASTQADAQASSNTQSSVTLKSSTPTTNVTTQAQAAGTIAEAAFQLTNQHDNSSAESAGNRSMGAIINTQALAALTNETGSTSTKHILRAPAGLDEATSAKWLTIAKQLAAADQAKTGRSQQIIMVSDTAPTVKSFAIGQDTSVPSVDAVDVASYQSWMTQANYNQLKVAGVKTVIVKISQGTDYSNPYAATQIKYAKAAGLNVAIYHFATFSDTSSAAAEAKQTISTLKTLGLPTSTLVFADMEDNSTNTSTVSTNLNAYWTAMNAGGYTNHGVYTGGLFGSTYAANTSGTVGASKTWYAQYPYTPSKNDLWNTGYGAWQFSSTAYLSGYQGNAIDASHDYDGLLSGSVKTTYDTITSTKNINLPGTINQTNRADGFYSAPYNTNAATAKSNSNGKAFNGQTVQVLEQATTSRSASAGNTFYKIRFVNGKTYWTDQRAVKLGSFYSQSNKHSVNYKARIDQTNRNDGLYPDGPYKTSITNIFQNSNARNYNKQIVPVSAEVTTPTGTYCQIKLSNGAYEWIDKKGLNDDIYDHITETKSLSFVARINQAGRSDGLYSAPYNTSFASSVQNSNAKQHNGQAVTVIEQATTQRAASLGNLFYEIRFNDGTTSWIDARGVSRVALNTITSTKTLDLAGTIDQSGRQDGLYSAPWNTDVLTITENHNAKSYAGQTVQVIKEATTDRSATSGNHFYEIKLKNGRELWIDARGIKLKQLETVKDQKTVDYTAQIVQTGRSDGLYDHPYNSDADSIFPNTNALAYAGRGVQVKATAVTSQGTYAKVTLPNGTVKWIDVKGLKKVQYDTVKSTKTVSKTGTITQSGRHDGLYSAPYYTDAMSILANTNATHFNGQSVKVLAQAITSRSSAAGNTFDKIQLSNGKQYWIDARGITLN